MNLNNPIGHAANSAIRAALRSLPHSEATERIALWWGYRYRPRPTLAKLRSGARLQVAPTDYLQMLVYYLGTFEPHCLKIMRRLIGDGDVVIDVGANVGLYTIEASRLVGDVGRVLAVEPVPQHVESLRRSLHANHMSNVEVIVTAAGDSSGTAALGRGENSNLGMYSLGHGTPRDRMEVTLSRIDDIVKQRGLFKVDLVKLDIEGAEYRALRGMLETLARHKPTLLVELNEEAMARCETTSLAVKEMLRDLGYKGWRVGRRGLQRLDDSMCTHACDECLFVHATRRDTARRLELS